MTRSTSSGPVPPASSWTSRLRLLMPTTDPPAEPARGLRRWEQRVSLAGLRRRSLLRERRLAGADEDELQALRTSWGADAGAGSKVGVTRPLVVRDEATGRPAALYGPASSSEHCNDAPGCAIAKLERDVGARLVVALPPAFTYETFALRSDFCLESTVLRHCSQTPNEP